MERLPRTGVGPRPDRHGQEHDVHCAEAGDRERLDEARQLRVLGVLLQREQMRLVADAVQRADQVRRRPVARAPGDGDPLHGQVDPSRLDAGQPRQRPFDRCDAGGALTPGHRQVGLAHAAAKIAAGKPDFVKRRVGEPDLLGQSLNICGRRSRSSSVATHGRTPARHQRIAR